jgi:hypothetical protein
MPLPQIHSINETIFGSSYEEHVKKFWQTYLEIPLATNPCYVSSICETALRQSDRVFYLPCNLGTTTKRTCRTSAGKSIFIPVICVVVLPHEVEPSTLPRQRTVATRDQDSVKSMKLEISTNSSKLVLDEEELRNFRVRTGTFSADLPAGGMYDAPEGLTHCVADGFYVITKPILAGTYEFKFSGSLKCTGDDCVKDEKNFSTNNTISLEVR